MIQQLRNENVGTVKEYELISSHTTMKIGGPADVFIEPNSIGSLKKIIDIVKSHSVPFLVIGRGSNLLVSDKGIDGVVIKLGEKLSHLEIDGTSVTVGGGFSLITLANILSRKGLAGLEFAGGIPGSIGGATYMNAGAHGSDMSQIVIRAEVLFSDGTIEWLTNEQLQFSYRTSILQKKRPGIVVTAELQLYADKREKIMAVLQKNKDYRKNTQPWNYPCAGSIFRNPLPLYAGKLIEEANLKGHKIGGAMISLEHANFIVNVGTATAQDVLDLIDYVKKKIYELHQVHIETEVEIIGKK